MTLVGSEQVRGRTGLAVGAALALAACALVGGGGTAAAAPPGPGPAVHGPVEPGPVAPGAAPLGSRSPADAATGVSITEGEVGEVGPRGTITYPSVTSCLVVTVYLRDGGKVGGHASLFQVPGKYASDEILPALRRAVGHRPVRAVDVSGAVGAWNPSYFRKAIERYTDGAPPGPTGDARRIGDTVAELLGLHSEKVTVRDVPDGDLTR
ncbi:hypothetical protein AB0O91_06165 [Kitasatospora sp. NPDC089797]|uniref:hypothetical protein n=1 Tax=Kitasatospora sp. NPDC089797 TaxID=3155298 RepID=UPI003419F137